MRRRHIRHAAKRGRLTNGIADTVADHLRGQDTEREVARLDGTGRRDDHGVAVPGGVDRVDRAWESGLGHVHSSRFLPTAYGRSQTQCPNREREICGDDALYSADAFRLLLIRSEIDFNAISTISICQGFSRRSQAVPGGTSLDARRLR